MSAQHTRDSSSQRRWPSMRISLFAVTMIAFGMLLWARLILVTGTPKTAYANPLPTEPAPQHVAADAPSADSELVNP